MIEETGINDLVLVHIEGEPAFFGRIEDITPDTKPGWWHAHIMVLSIPPRMITWILEKNQINGKPFTMGGVPIMLEKVISEYKKEEKTEEEEEVKSPKVISLGKKGKKDKNKKSGKNILEDKVIKIEEKTPEEVSQIDEKDKGKIISLADRFKNKKG